MLTFESFIEEIFVKIDNETIGLIDELGFFTAKIKAGVYFSSQDLRQIATKTDEAAQYGIDPHKCPACGNTPYFPGSGCPNKIHDR